MKTSDPRYSLFVSACASLGVTAKFDGAGYPSVSTGGANSLAGGVAHLLHNAKNVDKVQHMIDTGFAGVTRQVCYSVGTSVRKLGAKGGHVSRTVAGTLEAADIMALVTNSRKAIGDKDTVMPQIHTHKADLVETVKAVNMTIAEQVAAMLAEANSKKTTAAQKRAETLARKQAEKAAKAADSPPTTVADEVNVKGADI